MRVYTIKVMKDNVEVLPYIIVDGEEIVNGQLERVIWTGNDNFIILRNLEADSFDACNFFTVRAFDSDEFPLGAEIIIPEVTTTTKRILVMLKTLDYAETKGVTIIGEGVDDRDIIRCLLMMYDESEISVEGIRIQYLDGKLLVNGEVIE